MVQISATAQLKQYIDRYLEEKNGRSRQTLAKRTGVSYSTLSRIASLECETSFEQAIKILNEVSSDEERESFISQFYPHTYGAFGNSESKQVGKGPSLGLLQDRLNYEIFVHANHEDGASQEFIKEQYGQTGLTACNNLLENGLLEFKEQSKSFRAVSLAVSVDLFKNFVRTGLSNLSEVADSTNNYSIAWYTERLTPKACEEILLLLRDVREKVMKVMSTPTNIGSIPYEYGFYAKPLNLMAKERR